MIFDPTTFEYKVDPAFDVEAWRADVEGRASSKQVGCSVADIVEAVRGGSTTTSEIVAEVMHRRGVSQPTVERVIKQALGAKGISRVGHGKYALGERAAKFTKTTT